MPQTKPKADGTRQLAGFLAKFDAPVAHTAGKWLRRLRARAPGATVLVYDAYNALSISLSASERLGDAFVAVVVYPRHVNVAFHRGAELNDPGGLLAGRGARIRHVRVVSGDRAWESSVDALVRDAMRLAGFSPHRGPGEIVIKRVYERQRPRRPKSPRRVPG